MYSITSDPQCLVPVDAYTLQFFSVSSSLSPPLLPPHSQPYFSSTLWIGILSVKHHGDFDSLVLARSRLIFLCILFFPWAINTENSNNRMRKKKKKILGEILNNISKSASYYELGNFFFFLLNCLKQLGNWKHLKFFKIFKRTRKTYLSISISYTKQWILPCFNVCVH